MMTYIDVEEQLHTFLTLAPREDVVNFTPQYIYPWESGPVSH
jgi:hypothetical protein